MNEIPPLEDFLLTVVSTRAEAPARAWLADRVQAIASDIGLDTLFTAYATAGTRVGRVALDLDPESQRRMASLASGVTGEGWSLDDAARTVLLGARRHAGRAGAAFVADALACFEQGDAREQQSWLRGAAAWPEAGDLLPTVIDACRTNILPVFESVACENPYPARHFPELNFNQMVLKALFNGVALSRVVGLDGRRNAELARMADDYAAERRAADRSVPADIGLATGARPQESR